MSDIKWISLTQEILGNSYYLENITVSAWTGNPLDGEQSLLKL